jgi:hypothetical protein
MGQDCFIPTHDNEPGLQKTAAHNTDNKGYKTCHGFCKAFLHSREHSIRGHHRDHAAALNQTCVRG